MAPYLLTDMEFSRFLQRVGLSLNISTEIVNEPLNNLRISFQVCR
jgi:hypothetical protein